MITMTTGGRIFSSRTIRCRPFFWSQHYEVPINYVGHAEGWDDLVVEGDIAGKDGLALGVDISEAMLTRAVRNEAGPHVGFIRADAQRLPLRDNTVDAVVSMAVLQLVPNPAAALAEMARVLRPGGRLAIMVPTAGRAARLWQLLPNIGAYLFGEDEIGDILEDNGFVSVRVKNLGTFQWVRGKNG